MSAMRSCARPERLRILRPTAASVSPSGGTTSSESSASCHEVTNTHVSAPASVSPCFTRLLMLDASAARRYSMSFVTRETSIPVRRP